MTSYSDFCPRINDLDSSSISDSKQIASELRTFGFETLVLLDRNATLPLIRDRTKEEILRVLELHSKIFGTIVEILPPLFVFYFAGHGIQAADGTQYLVPYLNEPSTIESILVCTSSDITMV